MSYREENNQVILTMSREDYARVIFRLGAVIGVRIARGEGLNEELEFVNRLNLGNPDWTPYTLATKSADGGPGPGRVPLEEKES